MLYRKQNYLLFLSVILSIISAFLLVWKKVDPDNGFTYFLYPWRLYELNDQGAMINLIHFPYSGIGMLGLFNIFLSAYTLLWNNNLQLQKKFCLMLILVDITELIFCFLFAERISKIWLPYIQGQWGLGIYLLIACIVVHLFALIFIMRDIKLLRSTRHLR